MRHFITLIAIAQLMAWCCVTAASLKLRYHNAASVFALDKRTADVKFNQGANGGGPQTRCNKITYSPGEPEDKIWGVDCDALLDRNADLHGLYMFQNWTFDGEYSMLWSYGTCKLGVYRRDKKDSYTQIGDADLRSILTYCNKYLRSNYTMVKTVTGDMSCAGLQGDGNAGMSWTLRS